MIQSVVGHVHVVNGGHTQRNHSTTVAEASSSKRASTNSGLHTCNTTENMEAPDNDYDDGHEEYDGNYGVPYDHAEHHGLYDDLAADMDELLVQEQHLPLLELPGPCLQRLAAVLPPHRRMVLRQCSKALQQLVDASDGVALVLEGNSSDAQHATALNLSAASLTQLHTCNASPAASLQQLLQAVKAAADLPQLQQLSCNIAHLELLNAAAAVSPQLSSITLYSQQGGAVLAEPGSQERFAELLQKQLPSLSSLRSLHLHGDAMVLPIKSPSIARIIGGLTQLRSLSLNNTIHRLGLPEISQTCWMQMVAPLTGLTCIDFGDRDLAHIAVTSPQLSAVESVYCRGVIKGAIEGHKWYGWVTQRSQLTALKLRVRPKRICGTLLSALHNLRSLVLVYTSQERDVISTHELLPLAACSQLTHLTVDSLFIEKPAEGGVQQQLTSLRSLAMGIHGVAEYRAPLGTFAPNVTALTDVFMDWDDEWGKSPTPAQISTGTDALKGLDQLQLLVLDILASDYHVTCNSLTQLTGLHELQIRMMGNQHIADTENLSSTGLPFMPYLTKLVLDGNLGDSLLTVPDPGPYCLRHQYPEALLLWQHQSGLRSLQLKDSVNLAGFITDDTLLTLLPQKLPQLQCVELEGCRNLGLLPLAKLVGSRAADKVVVRSWKRVTQHEGISEQTCLALELSSGGAVQVDYCW